VGRAPTPLSRRRPLSAAAPTREVKADVTHPAYDAFEIPLQNGEYITTDIVINVVEDIEWKQAKPGA
jgi:hypothetical protein